LQTLSLCGGDAVVTTSLFLIGEIPHKYKIPLPETALLKEDQQQYICSIPFTINIKKPHVDDVLKFILDALRLNEDESWEFKVYIIICEIIII
jgi:hypothetical protein